jgi:hypothetical protein
VLAELSTGQRLPSIRLTDEELETIEEERVGEHFSHHPFLY